MKNGLWQSQRPRGLVDKLEVQLQSELDDAIWFTQRIHVSRACQGRCAAADLAEEVAGNGWRALSCIAWVLEIGMVEDIKNFRAELHVKALCQFKVLE